MSEKIRVLLFGAAGEQGNNFTKFLTQRGVKIVGAVGRYNHIGEDLGELHGVGNLGVKLVSINDVDLDAYLDEIQATVAIDCVGNVAEIYDYAKVCIRHGLNMLMIGMDCLYPFIGESRAQAEELDALAKEYGVSLCGCGVQDVGFINMLTTLSATCIDLKGVKLRNCCILDHAGPYQLTGLSINATPEEFAEEHKDDVPHSDLIWDAYEIAAELGLTVTKETTTPLEPVIATADYVTKYAGTVLKDHVIGVKNVCRLETEEGIYVEVEFIYSFRQNYDDIFEWTMDGTPSISGELHGGDAGMSTAIEPINRLPDIMNAKPGFLTLKDLPKPYFKHGDLNKYVL